MKYGLWIVALIILSLCVVGCSSKKGSSQEAGGTSPSPSPKVEEIKAPQLGFIIKTDKGDMEGVLYPDSAPNTVLNFVTLARKGFYNGLTFHRVVPGFVIQGGDPKGDGTGGPGYCIPAEFNNRHHSFGTLAMARAQDPNSAGSQFYICLVDCPQLDGKYTVFGKVTKGMTTALQIEKGDKIKEIIITGELPPYLKGKKIKKTYPYGKLK